MTDNEKTRGTIGDHPLVESMERAATLINFFALPVRYPDTGRWIESTVGHFDVIANPNRVEAHVLRFLRYSVNTLCRGDLAVVGKHDSKLQAIIVFSSRTDPRFRERSHPLLLWVSRQEYNLPTRIP